MNKLRIGIWLNEDIENTTGGAFTYNQTLLKSIVEYKFNHAEIILISNKNLKTKYNYYRIKWVPKRFETIRNSLIFIFKKIKLAQIASLIHKYDIDHKNQLKKELSNYIDIIYYTTPDCQYIDFPFIFTLWDLGHHTTFSFPEMSSIEIYKSRLKYHDFYAKNASFIFSESEAGKQDIIRYLNITNNKIKVVPLFASSVIDNSVIESKPLKLSELKTNFIHYPAQFWPHKNHYNLLVAFKHVLNEFPNLKLIFTGSDKGNKDYIISTIKEMNLDNNVIDLGFVTNEELKWLYINSSGLAMPTLLGPTNMPLLEAAELNCPVACSNFHGHIEQLGDYGYYFNPELPEDIAKVLIEMLNENRDHKVKKYISRFNISETINQIDKSFSEIKQIRFTWGVNY